MAADLGPSEPVRAGSPATPRSFGLASGKGHGEPWHVGMPGDVPGVGDVFDDFTRQTFDRASHASPEGMAGFITKIISTMTGALGKLIGAVELRNRRRSSQRVLMTCIDASLALRRRSRWVFLSIALAVGRRGWWGQRRSQTVSMMPGGAGGGS